MCYNQTKKNSITKLKFYFTGVFFLAQFLLAFLVFLSAAEAQYNPLTDHVQIYPHTKVEMGDYMSDGWNSPSKDPVVLGFMATHYDAIIGGHDITPYTSNKPPEFFYTNYYCVYVGNEEYQDAASWAASHSVDLESFFIHYDVPTRACYGAECYDLLPGSRVPSYGWYGSGGDLAKVGSRIIFNVGNSDYRAWKLDYLERQFSAKPYFDGVAIDNTVFNEVGMKKPTVMSGGTFAEYPHVVGGDGGADYTNDLMMLFSEFKTKFGSSKGQLPNVSSYPEDQRIYPYVWGIFREMTLQPVKYLWFPSIYTNIANAQSQGVKNIMGSVVFEERHAIGNLALYYMIKTDSTYFWPMQNNIADNYSIDPRINQWFGAVAYDIGQPVNDPAGAQKYYAFKNGIDPSSAQQANIEVSSVVPSGGTRTLYSPGHSWTSEQWQGNKIVFPSGYTMSIYHSGPDWVSVWAPAEEPAAGTYQIGNYSYSVLGREFENALVFFRPLPDAGRGTGDSTAVTETLPVLADNQSGIYFNLNKDGTVDPTPLTAITLRNTEGAILIKESSFSGDTVSPSAPRGLSVV